GRLRRALRPPYDRVLWALRTWLDSWAGIGRIAVGMAHQGYDLQLTRYDERGWRATFYTTGIGHSPTSATGTRWEPAPSHAPRGGGWEALDSTSRQCPRRRRDGGPDGATIGPDKEQEAN